MKEEPQNPGIDPELEARIVALVLGEASDFERDQLNRLIEERPELALLKEQIESVHGLLRNVGTGEFVADGDEWKLPTEKRSAVLAAIHGEVEEQSAPQGVISLGKQRSWSKGNFGWKRTRMTAVLCVAAFLGLMAIPAFFTSRVTNSARQLVSNAASEAAITHEQDAAESFWGIEATAPSRDFYSADGEAVAAVDEERFRSAEPAAAPSSDYKQNSQAALGALRGTLDFDVAASPGSLNGPEASPRQSSSDLSFFARDGANWGDGLNGGGERPEGSRAGGEQAGGVELSLPALATRPEIINAVESAERARSTVSVPDGGTVLLGGVKRYSERENEPGASFEAILASPRTRGYADAATDPLSDLGRPALGSTSASTGVAAVDGSANGLVTEGESLGDAPFAGGGFGGGMSGNAAPADARGKGVFRESQLGLQQPDAGVRGEAELAATAPSPPIAFGRGGVAGAEVFYDEISSDTVRGANSVPSPTNESLASEEDFKSNQNFSVNRYEEGVVQESVAMPSDDDVVILNRLAVDQDRLQRRPLSGAANPTVTGQRFGELEVSKFDAMHESKERVKESLAEISALSQQYKRTDIDGDPLSADYNKGVVEYGYWNRAQSGAKREPDNPVNFGLPMEGKGHRRDEVHPVLGKNLASMKKAPMIRTVAPESLNEKAAEEEAFSTFSLHVGDVSFKLARAALARGEWPEAAKVRIEEFVNAFDYGDPLPSPSEKVACRLEQSIHPFLQQRNLLRVSLRTAAGGRSSSTPLRLTLLLDNSGSMERADRQQTVRRAFALLAQQLKPIDQVTLISFASEQRLLADKVSGDKSQELVRLIHDLPSEGGTNIEAALTLAFEKAREQQIEAAQNRVILLTDGAVNLGDANPSSLSQMISAMREAGIAFDAAGISAEGLNDEILEALTRQGDGRYYLLDSVEAADDGFARQIAGALRPSAKNVKVQIEFNPKRVGRYKLLGFEKHRLKQEDFRNDQVDAAEMAAAEAGVAVYQLEAKPDGKGDVGSVSVRFRDLSTGQMIENRWPIPYEADAPRPDQAAPSLRIATSAALLAAKLRGDPLGATVELRTVSTLIAGLPEQDRNASRVRQLQTMIQQARQLTGK